MQITQALLKATGKNASTPLYTVRDIDSIMRHLDDDHRAIELLQRVPSLMNYEPSPEAMEHYDGDDTVLTQLWRVLFDRICEENNIDPEGD